MAVISHDHRILKGQDNSHVDSVGRNFGIEDHEKLSEALQWADDQIISDSIVHKHRHIEEVIDPISHLRSIVFRPPSKREQEREINIDDPSRIAPRVTVPDDGNDERDFVD